MHRKHPDVARQGRPRPRPIPNHAGPRPVGIVGGYDDDNEVLDDESGDDEIGHNANSNNNMFHDFHDINEQQHVGLQVRVDEAQANALFTLALQGKFNLGDSTVDGMVVIKIGMEIWKKWTFLYDARSKNIYKYNNHLSFLFSIFQSAFTKCLSQKIRHTHHDNKRKSHEPLPKAVKKFHSVDR